jgi:hypothetical protein
MRFGFAPMGNGELLFGATRMAMDRLWLGGIPTGLEAVANHETRPFVYRDKARRFTAAEAAFC